MKKLHCARADAKFQPMPGTEFEIKADLVLLAMGFVHPVHEGMIKSLGVDARSARQRQGRPDRLPDLAAEGVRRRRHAARPVAGGVGDPRRPPMRPRDRQVPDGNDDAAALSARELSPEERRRRSRAAAAAALLLLLLRRPCCCGALHGAAAVRRGDRRGASAFGAGTVVSPARPCMTGSGIGGGRDRRIGAERRDAAARPAEIVGAAGRRLTASPFTSTRVDRDVIGRGACTGSRRASRPRRRWRRR